VFPFSTLDAAPGGEQKLTTKLAAVLVNMELIQDEPIETIETIKAEDVAAQDAIDESQKVFNAISPLLTPTPADRPDSV
jgi:hypothetical protein